jgi:hypothetical protein
MEEPKKRRGNPNWGSNEDGTGTSGNLKGPPKKKESFTQIFRELGEHIAYESDSQKRTRKEMLAKRLWDLALGPQIVSKGDLRAIVKGYEIADGKPAQRVEIENATIEGDQTPWESLPEELKKEFLKDELDKLENGGENVNKQQLDQK